MVKIDVASMRIVVERHLGGQPIDVKLSPDGSVFYVANQQRDGVSIVDPGRMEERAFIPTGKGAHGLYPSRDARSLYVTNRTGGSISVIEFASNNIVSTWQVGGSPDMLQVSPDGSQLWASGRFDGAVYVVNTATGQLLHRIRVGGGSRERDAPRIPRARRARGAHR